MFYFLLQSGNQVYKKNQNLRSRVLKSLYLEAEREREKEKKGFGGKKWMCVWRFQSKFWCTFPIQVLILFCTDVDLSIVQFGTDQGLGVPACFQVFVVVFPPEGRPGMSDVSLLSGISGLSFDSTLLSPLLFFCLVLLPFLSYRFLPAGPFFSTFSRKFFNIFR